VFGKPAKENVVARFLRNRFFTGIIALGTCLLSACTAPPDVRPFGDATHALSRAVVVSGATVQEQLKASSLPGNDAHAAALAAAWKKRIAAMQALCNYSDGLVAVTASAANSAATVQKIANDVAGVASAVGIAMPPAELIAVASEGAALVYKSIANARAARTIEESLTAADAALQGIAAILRADTGQLRQILEEVEDGEDSALQLDLNAKELPREASEVEDKVRELKKSLLATAPPQGSPPISETVARLTALQVVADSLHVKLTALDARRADLHAASLARKKLLLAANAALDDWAAAHQQLIKAVRERRPIDTASLVETVTELRSLIKKVRDL